MIIRSQKRDSIAPIVPYRAISDQRRERAGSFVAARERGHFNGAITTVTIGRDAHPGPPVPDVFATALTGLLCHRLDSGICSLQGTKETIEWLLDVRGEDGFWSFRGPEGGFPPDLDDTAVTAHLLFCHGLISSSELEELIHAFPLGRCGLFGTWMSPERRQTYDITVNAHAAAALIAAGRRVPGSVVAGTFGADPQSVLKGSPYYCSLAPFVVAAMSAGVSQHNLNRWLGVPVFPVNGCYYRRRTREVYYYSSTLDSAYRAHLIGPAWPELIGNKMRDDTGVATEDI